MIARKSDYAVLDTHRLEQQQQACAEAREAIGSRAVAGIVDTWTAARAGRGHKLVVEDKSRYPARVVGDTIEPSQDNDPGACDAVEDTIEEVVRHGGDVRDRRPLIVDDMITTAGTVEAAGRALLDRGCRPELVIAATHGLFVGPARSRLGALPLRRVLVTDTVPASASDLPLDVISIAGLLADTLRSLAR